MKLLILVALAAVAVAAPQYSSPESDIILKNYSFESERDAPILKDERIQEEDGRYNFEVETGNGIVLSQSGSPEGEEGAISKAGHYSYTAPDGTVVTMKFVANENGFQPESPFLPVAPEFPHPIPQFVLDQIAFAAEQDAARARAEVSPKSYA